MKLIEVLEKIDKKATPKMIEDFIVNSEDT